MITVDVWNLHLHGNDWSLHRHINSCTASQKLMLLKNRWTVVSRSEGWKTCKSKEVGQNGHWFGVGQRGSDAFVSIDSQKNLESKFLYWKILFIPEILRDNGILCFLVITRGLLDSLGFGDTWWLNGPWIWKVVTRLECAGWCHEALSPWIRGERSWDKWLGLEGRQLSLGSRRSSSFSKSRRSSFLT